MAAETILSFSNSNLTAQYLIVMSYSAAYWWTIKEVYRNYSIFVILRKKSNDEN